MVKIDFRYPRHGPQNNAFNAWLCGGSHRDRVAITTQTSGNPKHIYFADGFPGEAVGLARDNGSGFLRIL
jgi:hypothetical protein